MVPGCRRQCIFPPKPNYYFLAHLQCSLEIACKFIPWYLHEIDNLTSKKYAKTIDLFCAGNKVLVKYQAQGGGVLTPTPLAYALEINRIFWKTSEVFIEAQTLHRKLFHCEWKIFARVLWSQLFHSKIHQTVLGWWRSRFACSYKNVRNSTRKKYGYEIRKILLSHDTVCKRISEISDDQLQQLIIRFKGTSKVSNSARRNDWCIKHDTTATIRAVCSWR